nr:2-(3-amino-3-carboxypropyl)histidine synthase subunit 2-like [Tanacetum cinerariifolium]
QCNLHSSGFSFLLAVATFFTGSGNFFCQWELYNWQWKCLVHSIPNKIPKGDWLVHKGLIRRYEGPFPVIGRVGKVSYRVQLPPKLKIHPVFHVIFLKPYHGDEEDPERGVSKRAPTAVVTLYDREVEEILSDHMIWRQGVPSYKEYLIKWRDLPDREASWEAEDLLWQFADEIKRYHKDGTTRTSRA